MSSLRLYSELLQTTTGPKQSQDANPLNTMLTRYYKIMQDLTNLSTMLKYHLQHLRLGILHNKPKILGILGMGLIITLTRRNDKTLGGFENV